FPQLPLLCIIVIAFSILKFIDSFFFFLLYIGRAGAFSSDAITRPPGTSFYALVQTQTAIG
ncbi:MAG: hypothetical protein KJ655_00545, partial [Candidatus Thermoplasmatota archaeon]|nr:hypothetical protein [Candidatus Thermoplasmatota archaeon]